MHPGVWVGTVCPLRKGSLPFFFAGSISGKNRGVTWSLFVRRKPAHSQQDERAVTD